MSESDIILTIVFSTLLILLLIAGLTISFFLANRQRIKQQMELAEARLTYERELRQVEMEVSEHMQELFAQELHDNIGHILTCMRLEIENRKLDDDSLTPILLPIEGYLSEASQQLRLLSRSLNTGYVFHVGLVEAIQLEVARQQQLKKFLVHWRPVESSVLPLDKNQELMVFRIFQEILTNAIRHSKARNFYISLQPAPDFALHIRDDGRGFLLEEILQTPKASGLKNVMKRADMANLHCAIDSKPGEGCLYKISKNGV
jgi:two-component system, NarL family, sensor kinase